MNKEFIQYEQSLELKGLGFDEPCFGYYVDGELRGVDLGMEELGGSKPYYQRFGFHVLNNHDIDNPNKVVVTAPTYSQCFRWFRDNHNLGSIVSQFGYAIEDQYGQATTFVKENENPLSYGESELACLKKLIQIVKRKTNL
jgi:hypothetical protein